MPKIGEHAVVLGASMGGLLAARVPPEFYDAVTVEERDVLPDNPVHRRGFRRAGTFMSCWDMAPKSWASCSPGLLDELVAAGATAARQRIALACVRLAHSRLVYCELLASEHKVNVKTPPRRFGCAPSSSAALASNDQNLWMTLGGAREWAHLPGDDLKSKSL